MQQNVGQFCQLDQTVLGKSVSPQVLDQAKAQVQEHQGHEWARRDHRVVRARHRKHLHVLETLQIIVHTRSVVLLILETATRLQKQVTLQAKGQVLKRLLRRAVRTIPHQKPQTKLGQLRLFCDMWP